MFRYALALVLALGVYAENARANDAPFFFSLARDIFTGQTAVSGGYDGYYGSAWTAPRPQYAYGGPPQQYYGPPAGGGAPGYWYGGVYYTYQNPYNYPLRSGRNGYGGGYYGGGYGTSGISFGNTGYRHSNYHNGSGNRYHYGAPDPRPSSGPAAYHYHH